MKCDILTKLLAEYDVSNSIENILLENYKKVFAFLMEL